MFEVKERLTEISGKTFLSSETLLEPFAFQTNVISSKLSVWVVLVLVLVPSC